MNETDLIGLCKELMKQSEELGRVKAMLEVKSNIIDGLVAQMGLFGNTGLLSKITEKKEPEIDLSSVLDSKPHLEVCPQCVQEMQSMTDVVAINGPAEPEVKSEVEAVKPKRKYTKRAKKVEEQPVKKEEEVIEGGKVFSKFSPLNLKEVVIEGANTSAYSPRERNSSDTFASLAASLGVSNGI